jgi:predicted alpha/beta-hydrolase family hydrolase
VRAAHLDVNQDRASTLPSNAAADARVGRAGRSMEAAGMDFLFDGPGGARTTILLAHGAGAPMDSASMQASAAALAAEGFRVARFEFAYMAARRKGERRPPDRLPVLRKRWLDVIESVGGRGGVVIGGKSMGGRIASLIADEAAVSGLVCLGYPFHPIGKPETLRTAHLATLRTPALFLQGTRDPMGTSDDVAGYTVSPAIRVHWLEGGDHSFKPPKGSGRTEAQNVAEAVVVAAEFTKGV